MTLQKFFDALTLAVAAALALNGLAFIVIGVIN